jgi:hypothetical protein
MTFEYQGRPYSYPTTLSAVTLQRRIEWEQEYGKDLAARAGEISEMKDGDDKDVELSLFRVEHAVKSFAFFTGIDLDDVTQHIDVRQVLSVFENTLAGLLRSDSEVSDEPIIWNDEFWTLPMPELFPDSAMSFNEFLVAKEIVRQIQAIGAGRLEALPYIAAVYLRKEGEAFSEDLVKEGGERVQLMHTLPMDIANQVASFFERHNDHLHKSFSVFRKSRVKGPNLSGHFDRWGWVSFLTYVAEAGLFTVPGAGLNAIDCAKNAKLYDVLVYASEKKDHDEAINLYYENYK